MGDRRLARAVRWAMAAVVGTVAATAGAATATGTFSSAAWEVPIVDAYAFHAEASLGGDAVLVVITNQGIGRDFFDATYDRRYLFDHLFADDETRVVYLEFAPDGAYRGYSYYFESGDGCGFCGGGARSTVKLAGGRLAGQVVVAAEEEGDVAFDVTLDVPIASDDHGPAQGAGGGAPGAAYLAYHDAVTRRDVAALRKMVAAGLLERWQQAEADGEGDAFLAFLADDRPQTVRVSEAFVDGPRAIVLVSGASEAFGAMHGEVHLVREGGAWKFDDEFLQMGGGDE